MVVDKQKGEGSMKRYLVPLLSLCLALVGGVTAMASDGAGEISAQAAKRYVVTVLKGKNGKVSGKKRTTVTAGSSLQYTVTPSKSYLIDALTVNGAPKTRLPSKAGKPYTFKIKKINENITVNATFAQKRTLAPLSVGSQVTIVDAK